MKVDIGALSKEELNKLENYIVANTSADHKEYAEKFSELLKSKKVDCIDISLLDQVYEGLTDIVKSWFELQNIADEEFSLTDIICAPETKIGKFLKTFNKPQVKLEKMISKLKDDEDLIDVFQIIADVQVRRTYLQLNDYDLNHTKRTLFLVACLMNMRKDLNYEEKKIIYKAVEFHDIGRIYGYSDENHAERAIEKLTNELDTFTTKNQQLIKFLIRAHSKTLEENEFCISQFNVDERTKNRYRLYINYVKDSDKLDRVRFPEISSLITNALDPSRLYFDEAKQLIVCACELLENFNLLLDTDPGDEAENYLKSEFYNVNEVYINTQKLNSKINARVEILKGIRETLDENKKKKEVAAKSNKKIENQKVFRFFDQNFRDGYSR